MNTARLVVAIDDQPDDLYFLEEAWKECELPSKLRVFDSPGAALKFFADGGSQVDLVLVDQNMPMITGCEFIERFRKDLKRLAPAVVLSTSDLSSDVEKAYRAGANAYLVKPQGMAELGALVRCIEAFWLKANRIPN